LCLAKKIVLYRTLFLISGRNNGKIIFLKFPESSNCPFSLFVLQQRITFIISSNLKICWFVVISLLEPGENSTVGHKAKQACSFLFSTNQTFLGEIQGV
jgi:hypothetical protein